MRESGNGLDYYATIQELEADQDYLVKFNGKMPLQALIDLVWELHDDDDTKQKVRAYTSCNRYGLPSHAMLCMDEKVDDADVIAVDNQGHVYVIDYESESLDYKITDKTAGYASCPRARTVDKDSFAITASKPGLIRRLKSIFRAPDWSIRSDLSIWIFLIAAIAGSRLSLWMDLHALPDFLTDPVSIMIMGCIVIGLCSLLYQKGYIKLAPTTMLAIIGSPYVACIFANYYITTAQRERVAVITDKAVGDDSTWIEWRYTDDNSSFDINDDDIHHQFQVGDTCLVDCRHGVMGWPVVRGIMKK